MCLEFVGVLKLLHVIISVNYEWLGNCYNYSKLRCNVNYNA